MSNPYKDDRFRHHRGPVTTAMPVPGTNMILTAGYDGAVGIFSPERIELLGYHDHLVNRIVTDQTGTWAASCSSDYTVKIWHISERCLYRTLQAHSDDVEDFAFVSPELAASASRDRRILIWNWRIGRVERVLLGHQRDVLALASDGIRIYSTGDDRTLRVWSVATGRLETSWGPFEAETDTCAIDMQRNRVVLGCDDGYVRVFSLAEGALLAAWKAHTSGIKRVAVNPVDGSIVSAAYDQRINIWDGETLKPRTQLDSHPSYWERSINWSPDGRRIVGGTFDGTIIQWDAASGRLLDDLGGNAHGPQHICWNEAACSPDGTIAAVSDDGHIRVGNVRNDPDNWLCVVPEGGRILMNAVAYDPTHRRVLAGSHNHILHQLHLTTNGLGQISACHLGLGPINTIRFSDNGEEAWIGTYSGTLVHWNPDRQAIVSQYRLHNGAVKALRLLHGAQEGVSCSAAGEVLAWDWSGKLIRRFGGHTAIVNDLDLSVDGEWLVTVSRDFTLRLFHYATGQIYQAVDLGRRSPKSVLVVDSENVLVGDYWGYLLAVNLRNERVTALRIALNGISSLTRVGANVLATAYDGSLLLIDPHQATKVVQIQGPQQRIGDGSKKEEVS